MNGIIDGGKDIHGCKNQVTSMNFNFGKTILQALTLFFSFNDWKVRLKPSYKMSEHCGDIMRKNAFVIADYIENLGGMSPYKALFFRNPIHAMSYDLTAVMNSLNYLKRKSRVGIVCSWEFLKDKNQLNKGDKTYCSGLWVQHFAVLQSIHRDLVVTGKSSSGKLMSGNHVYEFLGGRWEDFLTYNEEENVEGSRIQWSNGTVGDTNYDSDNL